MTGQFEGKPGARPRGASVQGFRNTILDQVIAAQGTIRYCVRWDSSATVTPQMRDKIAAALERNVNEWFAKLAGHNCWPYHRIPVTVTGWAVRNRNQLQWSDDSVPIYVNNIREGAPQCAETCGRFFNQQAGTSYPSCPGGFAKHYDMSLWLTDGMRGGAGGDWGQRVGTEYFTGNVDSTHLHIFLHELGHGFGFPDYYEWASWVPGVAAPYSVMVAGLAGLVTDWDGWMLRRTWNELRSRLQ
jgi:hypothetical protein